MKAQFSFSDIWNSSIIRDSRPLEKRSYAYATEIQSSMIDVWLKMRAVPFSNRPNDRSERKFQIGELFEFICGIVLMRSGIMKSHQERIRTEFEIPISGKIDFMAGGVPDYAAAEDAINRMAMPEKMHAMSMKILELFKVKYGVVDFEVSPIEIKSVSSYVLEKVQKTKRPLLTHEFQALHYAIGGGFEHAKIVYVCRDDALMEEFNVEVTPENINRYRERIAYIAKILLSDEMPPLEPLILLEDGKFGRNVKIEWSNYLTKLYKFETPEEYRDSLGGSIERWNRVISRFAKEGTKITTKNEDVKKEIIAAGYDFDAVVAKRKSLGVTEDETE